MPGTKMTNDKLQITNYSRVAKSNHQWNPVYALLFGLIIAQPLHVRAASVFDPNGEGLNVFVGNFYNWSIGAGAALAIMMLIYAGYVMITSAGVPERVGFAKEIIVGSLTGLALLIGAKLILNILSITT